jgi:predicted amidohydrolase YtcJ
MAGGENGRSFFSRRDLIRGSAIAIGMSVVGDATAALSPEAALKQVPNTSRGREQSDLALVNGRILTLDDKNTVASAVAIRDGRVAEVGRRVGRSVRTIDLKGATVIPGLIDAHNHIFWTFSNPGYEVRGIELATSVRELVQAISDRSRTVPPGEFITCNGGWNRNGLVENRPPTLAELDAAAPTHPIWLAETQTENAWIDPKKYPPLPGLTNSRGLAFFQKHGVTGDSSSGLVPWVESSAALQRVQTDEDRRRGINDAIDFAVGLGVTMIHDFGNSLATEASLESEFPYVVDLWRTHKLKLRFRLRLHAPRGSGIEGLKARMTNSINRMGDDVLRLNGFGEGLGEGSNASFVESAKLVATYGWSVHVHSVSVGQPGDTSQNVAHIAAFKAANAEHPIKDLRWSLAHVNYITPDLTRELVDLGVGVTGEAWQYTSDIEPLPMGPPWRMLLDSGIHIGAGSDGTGTAGFNPWLTIYYMTTGRINSGALANPGQTISRLEALKIHTKGSAWHSFDDDKLGTIEVGKLADLAVLSDDPLTVSDIKLRHITSTLTLQAGKVVHQTA